jgi:thiol-disulfide isomerase/thioredoxin
MLRLTTTSPLRVALLLVLGILALDYAWVQTHPHAGRARSVWDFGMAIRNACPDSATASAQSDRREILGEQDYAWKLTALDGRETMLEEHRGQVVFVNVWATWCGPCIAEMPTIQALYNATGKEGAGFVLVSEEEPPTVKSFVEQEKYSFPVFTAKELPEKFRTRGIPATFIVDKQGAIAHKHLGAADWNTEACRNLLRQLL